MTNAINNSGEAMNAHDNTIEYYDFLTNGMDNRTNTNNIQIDLDKLLSTSYENDIVSGRSVNQAIIKTNKTTDCDIFKFDSNNDGMVSGEELATQGTDLSKFKSNAGYDNVMNDNEWDTMIDSSKHRDFMNHGDLKSDSFKKMDSDHDGTVTLEDWTNSGMNVNLFDKIANPNNVITQENWDAFLGSK